MDALYNMGVRGVNEQSFYSPMTVAAEPFKKKTQQNSAILPKRVCFNGIIGTTVMQSVFVSITEVPIIKLKIIQPLLTKQKIKI